MEFWRNSAKKRIFHLTFVEKYRIHNMMERDSLSQTSQQGRLTVLRRMIFGDNLTVMREGIESKSVNLCCTDPPFNSGRNYNTFLADSDAQKTAFKDTWTWDDTAIETREEIRLLARGNATYERLNNCLEGYDLVLQKAVSGEPASLRAYLAFMGPRIAEIHRVLCDNGTIYLHCDPSASHYLKGMMDAVFGHECFRNEIVWGYGSPGRPKRYFPRKHDILLFYAKGKENIFNAGDILIPHKRIDKRTVQEGWRREKPKVFDAEVEAKLVKGKVPFDWWCDFAPAYKSAKEWLGYPTQKPRALYERIIKASSNPGDVVLDPFAGCGTTIDAAEALKRQWIGIDLTILALDPMQKRLRERYQFNPSIDYEIEGYPTNLQEAIKLARDEKKYHDFANWAVTRLGLKPTKKVGDGGVDGVLSTQIWQPREMKGYIGKVVAEVKSGKAGIGQVRAFCTSIRNQNADIGIFIMLNGKITKGMKKQQESEGHIEHNGKRYPRLQFWSIDNGYFDNPDSINQRIKLPWIIESRNKTERHIGDQQLEMTAEAG